jgi:hypothetical protein
MNSALPSVIRCPGPRCGATVPSLSASSEGDDRTVEYLREDGWQVVEGAWTCPAHLPADRAPWHRRNPHCSSCGDTRGGPFGHEAYECTWTEL